MPDYFDRYNKFKKNGEVKPIPGIKMSPKSTDKKVVYKLGQSRLDILSQEYYGSPYYGFLILLANPQFGGLEFNIPDGEIIRIPFPFRDSIEQYLQEVNTHLKLYGE
jgi:hypothetical protein